jgi:hypothetical protein
MTLTEFGMLLLFLMAFCIVPMIFIQYGFRSKPGAKADLRECHACGAQNYRVNTRCYCCGCSLVSAPPQGAGATLIHRVKQADERKTSSRSPTRPTQAVDDEPLPADKVM